MRRLSGFLDGSKETPAQQIMIGQINIKAQIERAHLKLVDQLEIDYFVNFVIFVPQTGQTALSIALPFDVVSLFTSAHLL